MTNTELQRITALCDRLTVDNFCSALLKLDELVRAFLAARADLELLLVREQRPGETPSDGVAVVYAAIRRRDQAVDALRLAVAP